MQSVKRKAGSLTFNSHIKKSQGEIYTQAVVPYISSLGHTEESRETSSSSVCGAGTSALEAVRTLTPVLFFPFISRGAPRQTA
jgi:hypothetical protein